MLTLRGQRAIGTCNVYADDADPLRFYYLSHRPRVALDADGKPIFSLVLYRRSLDGLSEAELRTRLGGGLLTVSVELRPEQGQLDAIRAELAADPVLRERAAGRLRARGIAGAHDEAQVAQALVLAPMPLQDGAVTLAVGGETGEAGDEFVGRMVGAGPASVVGTHRAAFMVKLTLEGAALVEGALSRGLASFHIGYTLRYQHRLDAVTMRVWCHARKSYELVQELWQSLRDNASFRSTTSGTSSSHSFSRTQSQSAKDTLTEVLTASEVSGVTVIPEAPISDDLHAELVRQGYDMLGRFLSSAFLDFDPAPDFDPIQAPTLETELPEHGGRAYGHHGIEHYSLKQWDRSMEARLNHVYTSQQVVEATLSITENVADVLGGRSPSDFTTRLDLESDFHKFMDVRVLCTADFEREPVDLVKVHLEYDQTGPDGRVRQVRDLVFTKDSPPGQFRTWLARPELDRYRYRISVHYSGSTQVFELAGETRERVLVLDVDTLGILDVSVAPGLVDWERVRQILVRLRYGAGPHAREHEMVLSGPASSERWVEVIGEAIAGPYTVQAIFVDASGQRLETPPRTTSAKRLLIDQPMTHTMRVDVVPAGTFSADQGRLSQIKVALRYRDAANGHHVDTIATLARSSDSFVWNVPLIDKELRQYEYQVTVVYTDGVVREDSWRQSDRAILPVGDPFTYAVAVNPKLLGLQRRFALGKIHLVYSDPETETHSERTFQIDDFDKVLHWHFRLGSFERKTYRYTLTLWATGEDGAIEELALPEATADQEVLVLRPPAA